MRPLICGLIFFVAASSALAQAPKEGPVGPSTWGLSEGARLYHGFCTPCHGYYGEGNGYNARFLQKKPADHTDPVTMSKRTDAKLFEIERDGGAKSGLSNEMPPWGKVFTNEQIWFLVDYMRFLQREGRQLAKENPQLARASVILPGVTPEAAPAPAPAPVAAAKPAAPAWRPGATAPSAPAKPAAPVAVAQTPPEKAPPVTTVQVKQSGPVPVEPRITTPPKPAPTITGHEDAAQVLASWKGLINFDQSKSIPGLHGDPVSGRMYYVENCATCHGAEGKGDGPTAVSARMDPAPRNHTDGTYMNTRTDEQLRKVVAEGGPAEGKSMWMPDWADKLSDAQIWDLVAYMRCIAVPRYVPPGK